MPHNLPPGVVQGPDGKFQSVDDGKLAHYDDFEQYTFSATLRAQSTDFTSGDNRAQFEGIELLDFDELVGRRDEADLIQLDAAHAVHVHTDGSEANMQTATGVAEISSSPSLQAAEEADDYNPIDITGESGDMSDLDVGIVASDSVDLVTRPLWASGSRAVNDATSGVSNGAHQQVDRTRGPPIGEWIFDRRDELYWNGELHSGGQSANTVHTYLMGQLVFGIREDC